MNKSTCIHCSVTSCAFNEARECAAKEITVGCNCCTHPSSSQETECVSFKKRDV